MRHIVLTSAEDISDPDVEAIVYAALKLAGETCFPGGDDFAGERTYDRQLVQCGLAGETGATTTGDGR
jgi:hypothetical protein